MSEHRVIWLGPECVEDCGERSWCRDDVWGTCEECGTPSVKYIIATEHEEAAREIERLRDIARRVVDIPHFKNPRIEALVRDAKDVLNGAVGAPKQP